MRALYLLCSCGHQSTVPWSMDRTTLRSEIIPRARCTRCGIRGAAVEMRIIWDPGANALDGSRTGREEEDE